MPLTWTQETTPGDVLLHISNLGDDVVGMRVKSSKNQCKLTISWNDSEYVEFIKFGSQWRIQSSGGPTVTTLTPRKFKSKEAAKPLSIVPFDI